MHIRIYIYTYTHTLSLKFMFAPHNYIFLAVQAQGSGCGLFLPHALAPRLNISPVACDLVRSSEPCLKNNALRTACKSILKTCYTYTSKYTTFSP